MITLIVAKSENNVIGKNNELIWHLPADLKHFKDLTTGHPIIMGRKTYDSIGKPLPNRTNIVITRNKKWKSEGVSVADSLEEAMEIAKEINPTLYIIGGGNIYEQSIESADALEVTEVHDEFDGDTFFPQIDSTVWKEVSRQDFPADEKNEFSFSFVRYERI
ncbi:MAG: dihydrofolate reductase [Moheibacter sp.]